MSSTLGKKVYKNVRRRETFGIVHPRSSDQWQNVSLCVSMARDCFDDPRLQLRSPIQRASPSWNKAPHPASDRPPYHRISPLPGTADPKRTPTTGALIQPHVYTSMMSPTRPIRLPLPGLELKLYTPSTVPAIQSRQPAETKVALIARSGPALCTESNAFSVSNWGGIAVFTLAPVDRESDPQPSSQPT